MIFRTHVSGIPESCNIQYRLENAVDLLETESDAFLVPEVEQVVVDFAHHPVLDVRIPSPVDDAMCLDDVVNVKTGLRADVANIVRNSGCILR